MTMEQMQHTITDAEAVAVAAKFDAWARELTPRERACLAALLAAGLDEGDVAGFLLVADGPGGVSPVPQPTPVDPVRSLVDYLRQHAFGFGFSL